MQTVGFQLGCKDAGSYSSKIAQQQQLQLLTFGPCQLGGQLQSRATTTAAQQVLYTRTAPPHSIFAMPTIKRREAAIATTVAGPLSLHADTPGRYCACKPL